MASKKKQQPLSSIGEKARLKVYKSPEPTTKRKKRTISTKPLVPLTPAPKKRGLIVIRRPVTAEERARAEAQERARAAKAKRGDAAVAKYAQTAKGKRILQWFKRRATSGGPKALILPGGAIESNRRKH